VSWDELSSQDGDGAEHDEVKHEHERRWFQRRVRGEKID